MQNTGDRRPGLRPLSALLPAPTKKIFKGRGFAQADIATRWPEIVGADLARVSLPDRISYPRGRDAGATLKIGVVSAFAPHLQHLAPLVIERVNTFYGYKAVAAIQLIQTGLAIAAGPTRSQPKPLTAEAESRLAASLKAVEDEALKDRLAALGRLVLGGEAAR